tara:strand:- start:12921 stop:13154 length:234 start_codon:yes stop_codon:yes gene_type:complete
MSEAENAINYLKAIMFIKKNSLVDLNVEYVKHIKPEKGQSVKVLKNQHQKLLKMGGYSDEEITSITKNINYEFRTLG